MNDHPAFLTDAEAVAEGLPGAHELRHWREMNRPPDMTAEAWDRLLRAAGLKSLAPDEMHPR